jgi:hypothetical protein
MFEVSYLGAFLKEQSEIVFESIPNFDLEKW